jgi:hypothetical protein
VSRGFVLAVGADQARAELVVDEGLELPSLGFASPQMIGMPSAVQIR